MKITRQSNFFSTKVMVLGTLACAVIFGSALNAQEKKQWYKGNLHTHSFWSDGDDFPDMIVRWYVENDYQFLALTDHNVLSEGERWMSAKAIKKRGGDDVIDKYLQAMGSDVVEMRQCPENGKEIRLRTFCECQQQFDKPGSFMLMTGEEISDEVDGAPLHMNATNLQYVLTPAGGVTIREAMRANLRAARIQAKKIQREILVHLNHPNFGWAISPEDLAAVTEERFFEVFNAHPSVNHLGDDERPSVERIWDIANTIRTSMLGAPPMFGLATDDSHNYHGRKNGSSPGRGWIMVRSHELTSESILKSINAGDFYSSSGICIEDVSFDSATGRLRIDIVEEDGVHYETRIIGTMRDYDQSPATPTDSTTGEPEVKRVYSDEVGKTLATLKGSCVEFQMTGDELYVRATISSSKAHADPSFEGQVEQAWIQPVVWKK